MATVLFLLKRFVAQRLLGLAIVVTLGFTVGVLVAGPIYADASREAILSSALRTSTVTVKNARFAVYGDAGFAYQNADAEVAAATEPLPLDGLVRQGLATATLRHGAVSVSAPLLFRDGAAEHLTFDGRPPQATGEVALPAGLAKLLGVGAGDSITALGPKGERQSLQITGTFADPDRTDPFWFGSFIPFPPPDSTELPPALLARPAYVPLAKHLGLTTQFVWDAYLALDGVPFERAERIPTRIAAADAELHRDPALHLLRTTTGLDTLIELVRQRVGNLRVPIYLVVFQIGAVALAVLAGVGALVLTRQSFELAVLRSRGFSRAKLIAAQAVQAVLSAAVAYPIGLLVGAGLARLASHSNGPSLPGVLFPVRITGLAEGLGLVAAASGALILLLLSLPHVRRTILEERRLVSRESQPLLARYPVELFVAPLGIFAFVEVRSRGFLPVTQRGSLDPLVLLAPTLLLFTASFLALRLLLFVLRRLDRSIGRVRRLPAYLAGRRLGRSPGTSFATSLLLVLSIGLLVVSTSYRAIVIRNHEDSAHQQVGADWSIDVAAPAQPLIALGKVPAGATPIVRTEPTFERGSFSTTPAALAIDPASYASGGWWRTDYSSTPLSEILTRLKAPLPSQPIPPGTLEVALTAPRTATGLRLVASFEAPGGAITTSAAPIEPGSFAYDLEPRGGDRLLSLAFFEPGVEELPSSLAFTIDAVRAGNRPVDLSTWQPLRWRSSGGEVRAAPRGIRVTVDRGAGHVIGGILPPAEPIPVLVSRGVASSQGSTFEATVGSQQLGFRKVAVAGSFPSVAGDFIVMSAPALLARQAAIPEPGLAQNEVWAMGSDPRPALRRAGFVLGDTRRAGPIIAILSQLPQSLAVGLHFTAAAGGLGLVVIGVAVGLYFAQRRRVFEFASLRAMGTEPRQVAAVLLLEQGLLLGFSILAGAGLGFGILRLMMPYVGKSLGATFPAPVLLTDWRALGIFGIAIVLATGVGLLAALRSLLSSSVTSVLRGEAE